VLTPEDAITVIELRMRTMGTKLIGTDWCNRLEFYRKTLYLNNITPTDSVGRVLVHLEGLPLDKHISRVRNIIDTFRESAGLDNPEVDAKAIYEKTLIAN